MGRPDPRRDVVRGPYASFAESPIHGRDLAEVAARALLTNAPVARGGGGWS
jgi:hypothetical protein